MGHTTWTFVTLAVAVPLALLTVQFWDGLDGCVFTVTAYGALFKRRVLKVKDPSAVIERSSPPLSSSTRPVPFTPVTVPPMESEGV